MGLVLATRDGGDSWKRVFAAGGTVRDLVTISDRTAIASIGDTLFETSDAGRSWIRSGSTRRVGGIAFVSPSVGWGVRPPRLEGDLVLTTDGGASWHKAIQPCTGSVRFQGPTGWRRGPVHYLADVWFTSLDRGWALCGGDGAAGSAPVAVFRTTDGASSWTELQASWASEPGGLQFVSDGIGWRWSLDNGATERTTNGGLTWRLDRGSFTTRGPVNSIWFVSARVGYALGDGGVMRTTNGGNSWKTVSTFADA